MNPKIEKITDRIVKRSKQSRSAYLERIHAHHQDGPARKQLSPGNQAHAYASCPLADKKQLIGGNWPNIGIVTAYNDMLSAHAPFENYPEIIRKAAREAGATAQVAGGVPAMCDGVTQGKPGMELSLLSRTVIAQATAISLCHDSFDAALYLGVCDKIVPGLLIGALCFGHVPAVFVPAGPMPSGLPNKEKIRIRQDYARGKIGRDELLKAESQSYHSQGTCTFYGTANSNQMLMEVMGLHVPGTAFVPPGSNMRRALTEAATRRAAKITDLGKDYIPVGEIVDEKTIVNAVVGLMATGGSTNHALHIPAIAKAAGIQLTMADMADISKAVPLLCRIYPNGASDVNQFHAAGGMGYLIRELLSAGLLHEDVQTIMGRGLSAHTQEPVFDGDTLIWRAPPDKSHNEDILRPASNPFAHTGGLAVLKGEIGEAVMKVSAVDEKRHIITAPAAVFDDQDKALEAFKQGKLNRDGIIVLRFQGPKANGMPELHKLTPALGVLQDKGFKIALLTDGRMSGASGKVPAAIHLAPEAAAGGLIASIKNGDVITLDAVNGHIHVDADLSGRTPALAPKRSYFAHELFS